MRPLTDLESTAAAPTAARSVEGRLMQATLEQALFGAEPQQVKVGRFVVIDRIAGGGMGVVYRGFDPELGRPVAIKVLASGREQFAESMRREAQTLAKLNHPHIVTVYEAGIADGRVFVAMELVAGGTLADWCARNPPGTRARFERVVELALQAARGLAAAHAAGLVHRDLKPSNMLISESPAGTHEHERLRLADFGLARFAEPQAVSNDAGVPHHRERSSSAPSDPRTATGLVVGTPAYMPPEQFEGQADARSDQWSLCATFWEAAHGVRPYPADSLGDLLSRRDESPAAPRDRLGVPTWFRAVLARGLLPDPAARWPDVQTMIAAIERHRGRGRRLRGWLGASAAAVAIAWGAWPRASDSPCVATQRGLDDVWSAEVVASVHALPFEPRGGGVRPSERIAAQLDAFADEWRTGALAVCETARTRGEVDANTDVLELPSLAMACYRDSRVQMKAVIEHVLAAETVDDAVLRAHLLPPLSRCDEEGTGEAEDFGRGRAAAEALARARIALATNETQAAREHVAAAKAELAEIDRPGLWAQALRAEAGIACYADDAETCAAVARAALAAAEAHGDSGDMAGAWLYVVDGAAGLKRFEDADFYVERATSLLKAAGDPPTLRFSWLDTRMRLAAARGDKTAAYEIGRESLAVAREVRTRVTVARTATNLAQVALVAGDPRGAIELAREAYEIYVQELGEEHLQTARAKISIGWLHNAAGEYDLAEPVLRAAATAIAASADLPVRDRLSVAMHHGNALMHLERFDEAREVLAGALRVADPTRDAAMVLALRQTAASIELDAGNYREAVAKLEEIRRSMTGTAGLTTADNRITACVNLAVAYAKAGQRRESLAEAEMCRTELRALADSGHRGAAFRYLGDVFRLAGRRTDARECYDAAIERLDRIGTFGVESVEAHLGLAELRIDEGDLTAAGRELDLATRGLERATPKLRQRVADARARHAAASRDG